MPILRRLILAVMPSRWRADAEAESRRWMASCDRCGRSTSIWDQGGLRWRARGTPRMLLRCPHCNRWSWQRVAKDPSGPA